jgi:hypothetical protein
MTDVELTAVPQDELRLVISKDRYFSTTVQVKSPSVIVSPLRHSSALRYIIPLRYY